ncbi:hypothetical protein GCM10017643_33310 [Ancylobacter dichloromethanicus]|uniref:Sulfatase-modifying factor enzyme-like domain-containing protein n=1 Tax=Ancylobacter dichloromethanicus TaxID=518825 RepID=A0A9W6JBZ3_9HYPH|nr:hypothetical protein GCM10017643_33310 [Ancylobacter dichloromethanicus]
MNVCHADALACARWCGKGLPSEAEWEFAARGGLDGMDFAWGEELAPAGLHRANTWQSAFPHENRAEDGYAGTSPVAAYPANGYGLFDMIGNVWEWTEDWYAPPATPPQSLPPGPAACRATRAAPGGGEPRPAGARRGRPRARCSRAPRICARPAIAGATAPPPATPRRSIRPRCISASAASAVSPPHNPALGEPP